MVRPLAAGRRRAPTSRASAKELGLHPGELMTVASLVESEANRDQDRGKVARVIYNRLETDATNRLLQIDATVNYALGRDLGARADHARTCEVDSPYNTRKLPRPAARSDRVAGRRGDRGGARTRPTGDWVYYVTVNLDTGETKFTDELRASSCSNARSSQQFCGTSDRVLMRRPAARRCAVLGSPIAHSLSPVLHRAAYAELGLDWSYDAVEVDRGRAARLPRRAGRLLARAVADDAAEAGGRAAARRGVRAARGWPGRPTPSCSTDGRRAGPQHRRRRRRGRAARALGRPGRPRGGARRRRHRGLGAARAGRPRLRRGDAAGPRPRAGGRRRSRPSRGTRRRPRWRCCGAGEVAPRPVDVLVSTVPDEARGAAPAAGSGRAGVVFEVRYDPWPTPLAAGRPRRGSSAGRRARPAGAPGGAQQVVLMTGRRTSSARGDARAP